MGQIFFGCFLRSFQPVAVRMTDKAVFTEGTLRQNPLYKSADMLKEHLLRGYAPDNVLFLLRV